MFKWLFNNDPLRDKQQDTPHGYCQYCGCELYGYDNWEDEICDDCEAERMEEEE